MNRHTPRVLVAIALAALLAFVSSGCEFWQYNIANGNGAPANHGQDVVIWNVASGQRPMAMSLEEVCGHRFHQMESYLAPYGYHGMFDNLEGGSCGGNGYGNAIFHLGNRVAFSGHPTGVLTLLYSVNNRPHIVDAMAVAVNAGSGPVLVWVTHLEASDDGAASAQANQLLGAVNYWRAVTGWPAVVGGDFNLTPGQSPMGNWCGQYWEAKGCSGATHSAGKIDYLFASFPWKWGVTTLYPESDHRLLSGGN